MIARYQVNYDWLWGRPGDKRSRRDRLRRRCLHGVLSVTSPVRGSNTTSAGCSFLSAGSLLDAWLASLPSDSNGVRGEGGWSAWRVDVDFQGAHRQFSPDAVAERSADDGVVGVGSITTHAAVEISSGGEDVADGIGWGADSLYDYLSAVSFAEGELSLQWVEQP